MKGNFMRKRFQYGNLTRRGDSWVAQWWEGSSRRKQVLGRKPEMTKTQAQAALSAILLPLNAGQGQLALGWTLGDFVRQIYLPFYRRKWKRSTILTNEDRIKNHLYPEFESRKLASFGREELQSFLDRKGAAGLSFSLVAHLRWDLRQVFKMAVSEDILHRNPAELLFTPRDCPRPATKVMTREEVQSLFAILAIRERLIAKLAVLCGLRPGEIFGLIWSRLDADYADVRQRVYRGDIDSPKSVHSVRWAALSNGLVEAIGEWREMSFNTAPEAWVFPSETGTTPVLKDNCWRRHFAPQLKAAGLGWVNYHVMRRTHSCLLAELDVDPRTRAEQMGHTVDVNENVYTRTSLARRREAVNRLENMLTVN
jgi:integrase